MNLWVRSQDKMMLVKVNQLALYKFSDDYDIMVTTDVHHQFACGTYSTQEKALKVLDKIQKYLYAGSKLIINELGLADKSLNLDTVVYEMPLDEEVEEWN